jgi:hypothetical protein
MRRGTNLAARAIEVHRHKGPGLIRDSLKKKKKQIKQKETKTAKVF